MTKQIDWQANHPMLLGRSEVLKSLRHYLHHTISHQEERGVERGSIRHLP